MSCGEVMYQSHYSYFPYQRSILDHKQTLAENEGGAARSLEGEGLRESPSHYNFSSRHTSPTSFSTQGSVSGHGFPPLRDPGNSSDPGFLQDRETSRTSSETGFLQTRPRPDVLDKVKGEKDKDLEDGQRNAQYLSANCVIFTYYSGDITKAVDDHFSKALSQPTDRENIPLSARNLPASFWDSSWAGVPSLPPSELYSEYTDPWQSYMASMTGYSAHQMYTARSYSSLLLQSRREWVEQNYPSSPYPTMSGLEGSMQPASKDLYWF
ncbi:protein vestigial [Eurytemora carolleeae]|uniref:protein vestigial n=1 Tax=Eurytemora carolleeae TaxID=1294199 RepID=UPI000C78E9A9|nr:protein vestigial [Eurytemora carolleeae]|eukprot:XP_023344749.1 protein vestigial-like [Eurytemora affinis]